MQVIVVRPYVHGSVQLVASEKDIYSTKVPLVYYNIRYARVPQGCQREKGGFRLKRKGGLPLLHLPEWDETK